MTSLGAGNPAEVAVPGGDVSDLFTVKHFPG
jgi:hypothetical protein